MKTLHKIFHKDLFKTYFIILFTTVFCLVFHHIYPENKAQNELIKMLSTFSLIVAIVGPLLIFFVKKDFAHNVKFLINQHFSRSELIKFFFFSQTLRLVLLILNYAFIYIALLLLLEEPDRAKTATVPNEFVTNFHLYSKYFLYLIMGYSFIYLFYFVSLFSANKAEMQRNMTNRRLDKNVKKKIFVGWIIGIILIPLFHEFETPMALGGLIWCVVVVFFSINVLNRTFRIFNDRKSNIYSLVGSIIMCVPLYAVIYGMKVESHNPNLSYHERIDSAVLLKWMNTDFSKEDMVLFLYKVSDSDYGDALDLFKRKIDYNIMITSASNSKRINAFIEIFKEEKLSEVDVKVFVNHISHLIMTDKIDFELAKKSEVILNKHKMNLSYISELINSRDPYQQFAAIVFAKNSLEKDQFAKFYNDSLPNLHQLVINSGLGNRSIASKPVSHSSQN